MSFDAFGFPELEPGELFGFVPEYRKPRQHSPIECLESQRDFLECRGHDASELDGRIERYREIQKSGETVVVGVIKSEEQSKKIEKLLPDY